MVADFFGPSPLPQDRVGFFSFARRTIFAGLGAQGPRQEPLMRIRPIAISAAFAVALATLPLSTAKAQSNPPRSNPSQPNPPQYYPPPCSPFPLAWPFCVAGAVLGIAATIITVPIRLLTGAPPFGYYGPPYPPPPYYAPGPYSQPGPYAPPNYGPR